MHITVCDDQSRDRKQITDILNNIAATLQMDFVIQEFDNPHDLLDSFKKDTPDALLLDIDMPEGDGITVANTLAAQYPLLPILFVTNQTFLFDIRNGSSTIKCQITDIIYIESIRHYLDIYTTTDVYHVRGKLADYDNRLNNYGFLRIYISYLVNVRYIYQISSKGVLLDNKKLLPVSRNRMDEIKLQYARQLERFVHGIHI